MPTTTTMRTTTTTTTMRTTTTTMTTTAMVAATEIEQLASSNGFSARNSSKVTVSHSNQQIAVETPQ